MYIRLLFIASIVLCLTNCKDPSTAQVAEHSGFQHQYIQTSPFKLTSYAKLQAEAQEINIYLEGDGRAWIRRTRLAHDPSPIKSTTMQLAALDPSPNVVYLARPCQYSTDDLITVCSAKHWSNARYSSEVVASIDQAISQIKQQSKALRLNLIGFSGGGALAVLIAARRDDIASIRTVAGNLDLVTMEKFHHTSPLDESLDPMHFADKVKSIPQLHFIGAKDPVVPTTVARNFAKAAALKEQQVMIVPNVEHNKGWTTHWLQLLEQVP